MKLHSVVTNMDLPGTTSVATKKKPKRLTQEEIEEEQERVRLEEERAAEELKEFLRYKHVTPLELSTITHDLKPSTSPRDQLSYVSDKKALKELTKFREGQPNLNKFVLRLHTEILQAKPENIIKWVDRFFFSPNNIELLRKELGIPDKEASTKQRATGTIRPNSQSDSRPSSRK